MPKQKIICEVRGDIKIMGLTFYGFGIDPFCTLTK
jgi:hypothetical protein